jgi:glycosyltransferase involved in cell wall biosynthesis
LPTYYREGLPRVLMEAGACARAVVTTDMPGCRHVVRHGENGLLVPPRDADALASAIGKLIEDSELRKRMGAAGRERAVREFSEDTVQQQVFAVYRSLCEGKWPPAMKSKVTIPSSSEEATMKTPSRYQESAIHN